MKTLLTNAVIFSLFLCLPRLTFSQTIQLGALSTFQAYTGAGAVTNSGTFKGDVGTSIGVLSGFDVTSDFIGTAFNSDSVTTQARIDILRVYIHLNNIFVTYPGTHAPIFGNGETITAGVYSAAGAGSLAGQLTLDGGGDTNAVFIIKFQGAFTAGVGSEIITTKGTRAANIFWIAEGAISIGANSKIQGSLFSHPGAISLGTNVDLKGKMLATQGAITIANGNVVAGPSSDITIPVECTGKFTPAPAVDVLGTAGDFTLFTSSGAVANTSSSGIVGNVGTNGGAVTGLLSSTHVGSSVPSAAIMAQAAKDLDTGYSKLVKIAVTDSGHAAAFGSGDTMDAGVYYIGGAGSLSGTITLDANNIPDAVFIFRFNGAFTATAQSRVIFINGTRRCNVFWISEGASSLGAFAYMKGTVLANKGANNIGAGGFIEGRMLSTGGAIGLSTAVIYDDPLCFPPLNAPLPIDLSSFTAKIQDEHVQIDWITATEINQNYFNVERSGSSDGVNFTSISQIDGAGNSSQTLSYSAIDVAPLSGVSYYRLKQTDYDGGISYSNIKSVEFNITNDFIFEIYPNPFSSETVFHSSENLEAASLLVYNSYGRIVKELKNITGQSFVMQREGLSSGLYYTKLLQDDKIVGTNKLVITD